MLDGMGTVESDRGTVGVLLDLTLGLDVSGIITSGFTPCVESLASFLVRTWKDSNRFCIRIISASSKSGRNVSSFTGIECAAFSKGISSIAAAGSTYAAFFSSTCSE